MRVSSQDRPPLRRPPRLLALLLCLLAGLARGQAQPPADAAGDPPDRVARLSYQAGELSFLPAGASDWSVADINRPLTRGDRLASGPDARAELELDGGALRIAGGTDFGFLELDDQLAQVELTQGTLNLAVRQLGEGQSYEVDTPTVAVVVDQPGVYRIDVGGDGRGTRVEVFRGHATAYGDNDAQQPLAEGRGYQFDDATLAGVRASAIGDGDAFDAWCGDRDQRYAAPASRQYVSEDTVGYQDLDDYGNWQDVDDYGPVWYPARVAADWAPYRDGHWAWIAPWGWTWVDASPWGFAPYHYGRWAYVRGAWGWLPGPARVRPIYAPALVAFVGGARWQDRGHAPVGWFPLGPREVYNPWYRASRRYYTRVNASNLNAYRGDRAAILGSIDRQYGYFRSGRVAPGQRYANRDAPRGLTAVSGEVFAGARPVRSGLVNIDPQRAAGAAVLPHGAGIRPGPASFAPSRAVPARAGGFDRQVVARNAPPAAFVARSQANADGRPSFAAHSAGNVRVLDVRTRDPGQAMATSGLSPAGNRTASSYRPALTAASAPAPRADLRPGELPSARFVHPRSESGGASGTANRPAFDRPDNQPRPGVSFIANDAEEHSRTASQPGPGQLPRVPHFEAANREAQSAPREFRAGVAAPQPRFQSVPRFGNPVPRQRPEPSPRFQRQDFPRPERPQTPPQERPQRQQEAPSHPQHAPAANQGRGGNDHR